MTSDGPSCPVPINPTDVITMAHGGGGRLAQDLVERMFRARFANEALLARHDGARFAGTWDRLVLTTDSHVIRPLVFPGGDIGSLSVFGTCNDVAMCGARPLGLSAAFVLEEGLEMSTLEGFVDSMQEAAGEVGVSIVTGDTKTVEKGKGDGLYITTAGVGEIVGDRPVHPEAIRPGDAVILSGDLARHGIAIMAVREGLKFETSIDSDCGNLVPPCLALLESGLEVHCLRDCTRGGLGAALCELASAAGVEIELEEKSIPIHPEIGAACEILGLNPIHVACEGRFVCFLPEAEAEKALEIIRGFDVGQGAAVVGRVTERQADRVVLRSVFGVARVLDLPAGEQLPRIC